MLPFDVHIHKAIYLPCSTTGGLLSYFGTIAFVMTLGEAVVLVDPVEHWLSDGEEQRIVFFNTVMSYSAMMSMNNPDFMEPIMAQV